FPSNMYDFNLVMIVLSVVILRDEIMSFAKRLLQFVRYV
ncbi:MAG: hypothetical protein ACI8UX_001977, partial [Psychromonas sp.]